ncbi:MAG: methylated-DNA--[protein]-cysteine S-methyltransferase [Chloroflexia bacterium]
MTPNILICHIPTSAGTYTAALTDKGLALLLFPTEDPAHATSWANRWYPNATITDGAGHPLVAQLQNELPAYFNGDLHNFSIPLDMHGTDFQRKVWAEVYRVGYAQLRSYREIASAIGNPNAVRAVGAANGANPIPVIVPCHRIIGSDGNLVGYGGGLDLKRRLLELEGAMFPS